MGPEHSFYVRENFSAFGCLAADLASEKLPPLFQSDIAAAQGNSGSLF